MIQINLNYGVKDKEYKRIYKMRDEEGKEYIKNCIIYEINMDKYKEILYNKNKEEIEKNKYIIMLDMNLEELEKYKEDKVVKEYMEKMERLNQNPMFINWITKEKDEEMIRNTQLFKAEEKGINKGIAKGREQANLEIAQKMINEKVDIHVISKVTGLTIKEIKDLY